MGCSCNLFGRVISISSPKSYDSEAGRSSKSKKKWKKRRRGGPMEEEDEEDDNVGCHWSPHPTLPPACHGTQSMAQSMIYSNVDGTVDVMQQATAAGYSPAPAMISYAYAAPAASPVVVLEQHAPVPSKSRVRFALPPDSSRHNDEPIIANPVGTPMTSADTYYSQHRHHQAAQQNPSVHEQQVIRHEDPAVACPTHPAAAPPEFGHYYCYPTPRREAVYRIGTDANRFSMFSDENPNACAIV